MTDAELNQKLSILKDFQRDTVDHVFVRMYAEESPATRFLVADEAGLGKTMVARGIVAKAIHKLCKSDIKHIDIVYICSNAGIAKQNIKKLNVTGVVDHPLPDRITLLPRDIKSLRKNRVNFISFTPGTSFNLGSGHGKSSERALLFWLLPEDWRVNKHGAISVLTGTATRERFVDKVENFSEEFGIDEHLLQEFRHALSSSPLKERFLSLADKLGHRASLDSEEKRERIEIVGALRAILAGKCIESLEPDLVILDEFQRFRDLLKAEDQAGQLARQLFEHPGVRVLMLSATPYKMYTLDEESSGDDHYADFVQTVSFLQQNPAQTAEFADALEDYRKALARLDSTVVAPLLESQEVVKRMLRGVMVRTERLAATPDRSGMLKEIPAAAALTAGDVDTFLSLKRVGQLVGHRDLVEFWKSASYLLNFMDDYKFKEDFIEALTDDGSHSRLTGVLTAASGLLLQPSDIADYRKIDPGNARLRSLIGDTLDRRMWQLLWIPPSLPYYAAEGAFRDLPQNLTKRLVFSSWQVVPKVVAALLTYESERRMLGIGDEGEAGAHAGEARRTKGQRLRFSVAEGRPAGMPVLAMMYPSLALADIDPLVMGRSIPEASLAGVMKLARERCDVFVDRLRHLAAEAGQPDERWYWAAPLLLDKQMYEDETDSWFGQANLSSKWRGLGGDATSELDDDADRDADRGWADHVELARDALRGPARLGAIPEDLSDVLALMAVAGPGVCALRALGRIAGNQQRIRDSEVRNLAGVVAEGLRGLFNQPDVTVMLRRLQERGTGLEDERAFWRHALTHAADGNLQAVLDEYAHVAAAELVGSAWEHRVEETAKRMAQALSLRTATVAADRIDRAPLWVSDRKMRLRSRFAVRYGSRSKDEPAQAERAASLQRAFNSPFWPFVLCSTSVGQEGLDFHSYCHAVVHWNLPSNPVDLEQREGRVHRFKGHAVRKNVARRFADDWRAATPGDPWEVLFGMAQAAKPEGESDLEPFWVYPTEGGCSIERYVPALPLSRDEAKAARLRRSLAVYRMAFGQSRQEDLVRYLLGRFEPDHIEEIARQLNVDLSPDRSPERHALKDWKAGDDDDGVEFTARERSVSLSALERLLDEFASARPAPKVSATVALVETLLSDFADVRARMEAQ